MRAFTAPGALLLLAPALLLLAPGCDSIREDTLDLDSRLVLEEVEGRSGVPECQVDPQQRKCPKNCHCVRFLHFNDVYKFRPSKPSNVGTVENDAAPPGGRQDKEGKSTLVLPGQEKLGGLDVLKTVLAREKQKAFDEGFVPIVTFGGDHLGPSFLSMFETSGLHMIEALNELQVDVVNWGNHEFDNGVELGIWNMLCSRFPWLTANIKETTVTSEETPLLGSSWTRKKADWQHTDAGSVLGSLGDFAYQPSDGILEVPLGGSTTLCLAGLTTQESATKKYGKKVHSKLPENAQAKRFSSSSTWKPNHEPAGGCAGGTKCSVEELLLSCPARGPARPGADGKAVFKAEPGENTPFTFYEDWREVLPRLLENARPKCSTLVLVTHLKFEQDMEVLKSDPLISAVLGGHDHEPHLYMLQEPQSPIEQHSGVVVKVGLDGQYLAKVDVLFSEKPGTKGKFDHVLFDMRPELSPPSSKELCLDGLLCQPADILPVDGSVDQPDARMTGLMQSFEALTNEFTSVHLAKSFVGTFDTLSVRSRETSASNLYTDSLSRWTQAARAQCYQDSTNCILRGGGAEARDLPVVALVNSGTIRSNDYAEGAYPGNRPFSMLEVRADLPFQDQIAVWVMPMQDLMLVLAMVATDFGDGMFPLAGGLEFTLAPKRKNQLAMASGARNRPVALMRFRQPGEDETPEDSREFALCMGNLLQKYEESTKQTKNNAAFDWEGCRHFGKWVQDEMGRGSEVLVVGPEFMMAEAAEMLKAVDAALGASEVKAKLAGVGIPGNELAKLVKAQRKASHMQNLVTERLIIYNIVRTELEQHFGPNVPINAGADCVAPSLDEIQQLSYAHQVFNNNMDKIMGLEWALAAATFVLEHPSRRLCFRARVPASPDSTHVTDELQRKSSMGTEEMLSVLKGKQEEGVKTTKIMGKIFRWAFMTKARVFSVKRRMGESLDADSLKKLTSVASGEKFSELDDAWQDYTEKHKKGAGIFLQAIKITDLLSIVGPHQWLNDPTLSCNELFANQELARSVEQMWAEEFLLPEQFMLGKGA